MAEYEALVNGLHIAIELGIRRLNVRGNSRLIIDQVMKESSCHDPKMDAYCKVVRRLEEKFDGLELNPVLRKYNEATDALAKIASDRAMVPRTSLSVTSTSPPSTTKKTGARILPERPWSRSRAPHGSRARGHGHRVRGSRARRFVGLALSTPATTRRWHFAPRSSRGVTSSSSCQSLRTSRWRDVQA